MHRFILTLALCAASLASTVASAAGYYTQAGKIYDAAGQEVQIRGISHHGFAAEILQPQFIWTMGWKQQIAEIKSLGFNAVRVPFVPDTLYNTTPVNQLSYVEPNLNADLIGKTPLQVLDMWMAEADRQGLYVMLDFHSVSKFRQYQTWFVDNPADYNLIYNNQAYTKDNWIRDLKFVAARYASNPHFMAIDIYNEPNGPVRWSTGDPNVTNPKYFWKAAAEAAAAGVLASNPNLLIFVQGIAGNFDGVENSNIPMNWGEDFQPHKTQPLAIAANKLVFSPHTYGPDVYMKSSFGATNFPANLAADWNTLFGRFSSTVAIVPGEWGGRYGVGGVGQMDVTWQNAFVQYMVGKGMRNSFFWCYTPNSGDTGGILDDNLVVRQDKVALLKQLWGTSSSTTSTVKFAASGYAVGQAAGSVRVYVSRAGTAAATVKYATVNGTALAGTHYTATSGTLSWLAGDTTAKSFLVPISNAAPFQNKRAFTVQLSTPTGASVIAPSVTTVTITGSVVAPGNFTWSATAYSASQGAGTLTVVVKRNAGVTGAVSVQYQTVDGTARAGRDYTAKLGTFSWGAGDGSTRTFSVPISGGLPFLGSRGFSLKLSNNGGGATLGTPYNASVTIKGSLAQ